MLRYPKSSELFWFICLFGRAFAPFPLTRFQTSILFRFRTSVPKAYRLFFFCLLFEKCTIRFGQPACARHSKHIEAYGNGRVCAVHITQKCIITRWAYIPVSTRNQNHTRWRTSEYLEAQSVLMRTHLSGRVIRDPREVIKIKKIKKKETGKKKEDEEK